MANVFAALWRWLIGEETITPTRKIVSLKDIQTWADQYSENRDEFIDSPSGGGDELPQYTVDKEINTKVSIYHGDITSLEVDGIVRSTDASLTSAKGISGVIMRAAGPNLNAELKSLRGCRAGEAKTTSGFDLKAARNIVHTVGPDKEQPDILERCYKSCLEQMKLKKMKSLAICCISTGLQGYPNDKAVLVALKTVRLWLEELKTENKLDEIDRIVFCLFSEMDELLYNVWMQVYFPCPPEEEATAIAPQAREEDVAASHSGSNSGNSEDSIRQIERKKLRPLPGFIELTTEPDMIDLDDDPNTQRAKMPCGHVIGSDSMTDCFRDVLNKGKFKFDCPMKDCNHVWDYFLVRHVACFTDEEMRDFEKKLAHNFLQKEQGNQRCPGCKIWSTRVSNTSNCVRCPLCTAKKGKKYDFCWACLNEWKGFFLSRSCGNPYCDGKDKRILTLANCSTKKINYCKECPSIRGCPNCGILIEHRDKCGHVTCCNCHYGFCFICMKAKKDGEWQCKPYFGSCKLAPRQESLSGSR